MTSAEQRLPEGSISGCPDSANATLIALEEEVRLREKDFLKGVQEHLNRDSQGLAKLFCETYSLSQVPPCSKFVNTLKTPQETRIDKDGVRRIIPCSVPFYVPSKSEIPVETLASVSGVKMEDLTKGADIKLEDNGGGVWMLTEPNLSPLYPGEPQKAIALLSIGREPGTKKPDENEPVPVAFTLREYLAYRAFIKRITGEYPDQKTSTILFGISLGSSSYPAISAKGGRGERLEITTGVGINHYGKDTGIRIGWVAQGDLAKV